MPRLTDEEFGIIIANINRIWRLNQNDALLPGVLHPARQRRGHAHPCRDWDANLLRELELLAVWTTQDNFEEIHDQLTRALNARWRTTRRGVAARTTVRADDVARIRNIFENSNASRRRTQRRSSGAGAAGAGMDSMSDYNEEDAENGRRRRRTARKVQDRQEDMRIISTSDEDDLGEISNHNSGGEDDPAASSALTEEAPGDYSGHDEGSEDKLAGISNAGDSRSISVRVSTAPPSVEDDEEDYPSDDSGQAASPSQEPSVVDHMAHQRAGRRQPHHQPSSLSRVPHRGHQPPSRRPNSDPSDSDSSNSPLRGSFDRKIWRLEKQRERNLKRKRYLQAVQDAEYAWYRRENTRAKRKWCDVVDVDRQVEVQELKWERDRQRARTR